MSRSIPVTRADGSPIASEQGLADIGGGKSLADIIFALGAKTLENIFDAVTDLKGPSGKTMTDIMTALGGLPAARGATTSVNSLSVVPASDAYFYDNQISGVRDNGTDEGVLMARIQQGELVRVACADIEFSSYSAGSGSVAANRNAYSNGDHTGIGYSMQTGAAGLGSHIASLAAVIHGRTVGVRFRKLAGTPAFSIVIDGVAYSVPTQTRSAYFDNVQLSGLGANKEGIFVVNDLPDGPHSVRVILYPDAAAAKTFIFYGFLAERIAGYEPPQPLDNFFGGGTLTNANVAVPITDNASNVNHGVKSVLYYNTDASTRVVTITWNSIVIATISLAAGASARFDLSSTGLNMGAVPNLVHKADAGSVVTFICIGGL